MQEESKNAPRYLRYPLFLAGLLILVVGSLAGEALKVDELAYFVLVAVIGFVLLMISVLIR